MFLRYKGHTENFKYKGADFSKGPFEVSGETGKAWIAESPGCFEEVVKAPKAPKK